MASPVHVFVYLRPNVAVPNNAPGLSVVRPPHAPEGPHGIGAVARHCDGFGRVGSQEQAKALSP
eukprot:279527-Alexandrium_andersonii.AAC.1